MKKRRLQVLNTRGKTFIGNYSPEDAEPLLPTTTPDHQTPKKPDTPKLPDREYADEEPEPLLPPHVRRKEDDHGEQA